MLSLELWVGAILGATLGSIVIPSLHYSVKRLAKWWQETRPPRKLLAGIAKQNETCRIFVRDLYVSKEASLISVEPKIGVGIVPNVQEVWPDSEGRGIASIFNVLGQVDKTENIEIVRMSQDIGRWNCHVIVLGAQANKAFDFYKLMENVAYRMDSDNIYNNLSGEIIKREAGFGYGIILKASNPYKTLERGVGILIGGYGVLGTAAAAYYFREHFRDLGREFGEDYFGIIVRAPVTAGEEAVERLKSFDVHFPSKTVKWFNFVKRKQNVKAVVQEDVSYREIEKDIDTQTPFIPDTSASAARGQVQPVNRQDITLTSGSSVGLDEVLGDFDQQVQNTHSKFEPHSTGGTATWPKNSGEDLEAKSN
ncbi:MAG: hypothetical protein DPW09_20100 [Anaerolineae bacterium]|nr:hypothetical protein [Anaerolineales bacterium]MCQ3975745.1 hypothetical protein [Anaerolineae bacterium]